jgi:hypothetical protein
MALRIVEGLRPPLLRDMQDTGHRILSPLKKRELPDIHRDGYIQEARLFKSFTIVRFLPMVEMTEKSK